MPRHVHWVIIAAGGPTAFRAKNREVLLPTLRQLQRTQPDAELRWFEGNRLWASPAEANAARRLKRRPEKRPADWRPGGDHRDPRARFELSRDEKRARFKRRAWGKKAQEQPASGGPSHSGRRSRSQKPRRPSSAGSYRPGQTRTDTRRPPRGPKR